MPARKAERLAQQGADIIEIAEISRRIDVSETTIRKWIVDGIFPGYMNKRRYVVPKIAYQQWLRMEWTPRQHKEREAA